jgi:hypothetical protein
MTPVSCQTCGHWYGWLGTPPHCVRVGRDGTEPCWAYYPQTHIKTEKHAQSEKNIDTEQQPG